MRPRIPFTPRLSKCIKPKDAKKQIQRSRVVCPNVLSSVWNTRCDNISILLHRLDQMQQFRSITDETVLIHMEHKFGVLTNNMVDESKRRPALTRVNYNPPPFGQYPLQ